MMSCQTTIFSLPREIRDAIYDLVLNSPGTPPSCPEQAGIRYEEVIEKEPYGPEFASVLYPSPNSQYGPVSAPSQVNRQLRQESLDFITDLHSKRSVTHKLDAMNQGPRLWLSWTSVPHFMSKINNLEIDFRVLDTHDDAYYSEYFTGLHSVFILLVRAIDRLLNHGPSFRYRNNTHGLKVDILTINLQHMYDKLLRPAEQSMEDRESPNREDAVATEAVHLRVNRYLLRWLEILVDLGLFSGKVQKLRVLKWGGPVVYFTQNIKTSIWLSDELAGWGIKWGSDKDMRVKKVNSADLCPGKDEVLN